MAIAFDASSALPNAAAGTSATWNHTCTGSNLALTVQVTGPISLTTKISSVTYNGVTMPLYAWGVDNGGSELYVWLYVLVAPATGSNAVVVNFSATLGSEPIGASAASFTGVHQSYPVRTAPVAESGTTSGTAATVTTKAIAGDYIVGAGVVHQTTIAQGAVQTAITTQNGFGLGSSVSWASAYVAAASQTTLSWTQSPAQTYTAGAVVLRPDTETVSLPAIAQYVDGSGDRNGFVPWFQQVVNTGANATQATISWQTGDIIVVIAGDPNHASSNFLNTTLGTGVTLTATGLTFTVLQQVNSQANQCAAVLYAATAASSATNVVVTFTPNAGENQYGFGVFVIRGSSGVGQSAKVDTSSTTKTVAMTSQQTNSLIIWAALDWGAGTLTATPTPSIIEADDLLAGGSNCTTNLTTLYTQPSTSPISYGITGGSAAGPFSVVVVELKLASQVASITGDDAFLPPVGGGWDSVVSVW